MLSFPQQQGEILTEGAFDPKIQQTKILVTCQRFVFIWAGLAVFFGSDKI